ncbi:MAG: pantoate--beta-alanine ligase [Wohlfahrtiimonas sp.]
MKVIKTIAEIRAFRENLSEVALVPTMGNLHEGHLSLVKAAQAESKYVIVSIFVNPIQFGPNEDFGSYPRTLLEDCEKLEALGVDAVFAPNAEEMYPKGIQSVRVVPSDIQRELCGASREGHFNGVATVVTKLFNIVQPTTACFGEKDFQQLHIIREMVEELNMPIKIVAVPICREDSGLALSSRNGYLSIEEKAHAIELSKCLAQMKHKILDNHSENVDLRTIETQAIRVLNNNGWIVDYISIRDQKSLAIADYNNGQLIILAAAKMGKTRLLDNLMV